MSFNKVYPNRKDQRAPYFDARRFDRTCRNHGSCPYCVGKRLHFDVKHRTFFTKQLSQYRRFLDD